jgi:hypothetical protein
VTDNEAERRGNGDTAKPCGAPFEKDLMRPTAIKCRAVQDA